MKKSLRHKCRLEKEKLGRKQHVAKKFNLL
jgi:hypothetical protein